MYKSTTRIGNYRIAIVEVGWHVRAGIEVVGVEARVRDWIWPRNISIWGILVTLEECSKLYASSGLPAKQTYMNMWQKPCNRHVNQGR